MDDSSPKPEFRVVDKRRFSAEGEERGDVADDAGSTQADTLTSGAIRPEKGRPEPVKTASSEQRRPAGNEPEGIDFSSFVVSMGTQALMALGEIPHPETRTATVNLDAAKQMIDILGLLETKTAGNLTAEEEKLLQEILASLRMLFTRKVR